MSGMAEARRKNMDIGDFVAMLEKNPHLKQDLFIRGFLITNRKMHKQWKCGVSC